jgi:predicted Zn-dependent protease
MKIRSSLAALALASSGCSAPEGPAVTDADRALGARQHPALLAEFGGTYDGPQAGYVAALGEKVAGAAGLAGRCTFTLVNSDVVNAFAVPGCYIYITRGLMGLVTSEAELASVIAHEVGHIVANHSARQQQRSFWRALGVFAVSLTGSERLTQLAGQAATYFTFRYSRDQEYQSDDLGLTYLERAGYDPYAAADMLGDLARHEKFMTASSGVDAAQAIPEWARTHPLTENRIARARTNAGKTGLKDDQLPERAPAYFAAVDGMLYGDDPAQGFVTGRSFAHPAMRIAFEAPVGFTLTNSPQSIGLSGPGGLSGEFGGGRNPAGRLDEYPIWLARHIAGKAEIVVRGLDRSVIGGAPAVIASLELRGGQRVVPLWIAAYAGGGDQVYHFLLAGPPESGTAQTLTQLFGSFRFLSPAEAARLSPRVIRVVRAEPGAALERFVAATADPSPKALFLTLNDLRDGQPIAPGKLLKIVVDAR